MLKGHKGLIAYYRVYENEEIFIILNFTGTPRHISINNRGQWKNLLSTHKSINMHYTTLKFSLDPYEATIIEKIGPL